jgi:anti-sigma factor RsiW
MTEDEVRLLLRELRDDAVPPDSLARVRLAVAERSRGETWIQRLGSRWKILSVVAAAVVILLMTVRLRPVSNPSTLTATIQSGAGTGVIPAPPAAPKTSETVPTRIAAKPKNKRSRKTVSREEPVLVRIETPDPDVLILLIGD